MVFKPSIWKGRQTGTFLVSETSQSNNYFSC